MTPPPLCPASSTGEIFLRFCSFVRQLGVAKGGVTTVKLLDDGEFKEGWVALSMKMKKVHHQSQGGGACTCIKLIFLQLVEV